MQRLSANELATIEWKKLYKKQKRFRPLKVKIKVKSPPLSSIASYVAKYYNVSYRLLLNSRQNKVITRYRWVLFYICQRILNYSYRKIASGLGIDVSLITKGLQEFIKYPQLVEDAKAIRLMLNRKYAV